MKYISFSLCRVSFFSVSFFSASLILAASANVVAEDRPQQKKTTQTRTASHSETGQVTIQKPEQKGFLHRKQAEPEENVDQEEELDFPEDEEMAQDSSH